MKIFINFKFVEDQPSGGGNQFLKSLRDQFIKQNLYTNDPIKAKIILLNSHHEMHEIWKIKKLNPNAVFPHRIDGPMQLWRGINDNTDKMVYYYSGLYADGIIFQSEYSQKANATNGFRPNTLSVIIYNAPNLSIFYSSDKIIFDDKIKIIATSWSDNILKGFNYYKFLDENLDFNKYEMTFIGRSPIEFKNIKKINPLNSEDLAEKLRKSNIFITGSEFDPSSNSVVEALTCGLPVVYKISGGHSELVKQGGIGFNSQEEIISCVEKISLNLDEYRSKIQIETIEQVAKKYIDFFEKLLLRRNK